MTDPLMNLYNRAPIAVDHGEGVWLTDTEGRRYIDCVAGIATDALGHAHPKLVAALTEQAQKLWHVSNIFRIPGQEALAQRLVDASFADVVFFANTGTEAVECAIKTARRHHHVDGQPERIDVIGFAGSFHGRTYAAINASGNAGYMEGCGPRLPGFVQLSLDDATAIEETIARPTTAAVIVEPVQGEGGARALSGDWLRRLRDLTRQHGVLLIHDEVQSGMGRTGKLFAHQWFDGAEPDIMALAKALGSGFPVGACLATHHAASGMTPGIHGTTFGGNPLAMAVGIAAFDTIADDATLANARAASADFFDRLEGLRSRFPDVIAELRGKGLLIGLKMIPNNRAFMGVARDHGLLVAGGGENCVRLLPSLLITAAEVAEAVTRLEAACVAAQATLAQAA
ncbi:MAG: aspartate aminotransferase family protein [Sphingomonas adhaesiva]|uniref:aspartate aminotransferase family protein n=1 Tax=Sphingomonas adhaesiva TaxID=28212 RepID=UPI002FFC59A6